MKIFQLRLDNEIHESLRLAAFQAKLSMNKFIQEAILEKARKTKQRKNKPILEHVRCDYCNNTTGINDPTITHREGLEPIWVCPEHNISILNRINKNAEAIKDFLDQDLY